jgi:hypothetical protein
VVKMATATWSRSKELIKWRGRIPLPLNARMLDSNQETRVADWTRQECGRRWRQLGVHFASLLCCHQLFEQFCFSKRCSLWPRQWSRIYQFPRYSWSCVLGLVTWLFFALPGLCMVYMVNQVMQRGLIPCPRLSFYHCYSVIWRIMCQHATAY